MRLESLITKNEIAADLASPNAATVEKAQKRIRELRTLIADYKNFSRSGDDVTAQAVKESEADTTNRLTSARRKLPEPAPTATQAVETPAETPVAEAAPVEAPAPVETKTELPDIFTTPAVRGMAQNAGLAEADFEGVTPSAKSGKYSVKDVKQIIASKGEQPATEPVVYVSACHCARSCDA